MRFGKMFDDGLYTEQVKKHIYEIKGRLPKDFNLVTEDKEMFISILVEVENWYWRPVEERIAIAKELNKLSDLINKEGIPCYIEKDWVEKPWGVK